MAGLSTRERVTTLAIASVIVAGALFAITRGGMPALPYLVSVSFGAWLVRRTPLTRVRLVIGCLITGAILLLAWLGYEYVRF